MRASIAAHEPSRALFLSIADRAEALVNAEPGDTFLAALFALDSALHVKGKLCFFMPDDERPRASLSNDDNLGTMRFFAPQGLEKALADIVFISRQGIIACCTVLERKGISYERRYESESYDGMAMRLDTDAKIRIWQAVRAIREYYAKPQVMM